VTLARTRVRLHIDLEPSEFIRRVRQPATIARNAGVVFLNRDERKGALQESVNNVVHTSGVCSSRGVNPTSNGSGGIFADSLAAELVTPSSDTTSGYAVTFQVGV